MFLSTIVLGFINSIILALVALGFNLTFGISGVANFAYGGLYVFAGLTAWIFINIVKLPYIVSILLSIAATSLFGALIYRFILQRVRGIELSEVIATFGIGLAVLELFRYLGFYGFEYTLPVMFEGSINLFVVTVSIQRVMIVIIGIALAGGIWFFTHHTKIGLAFRGIAQDEYTALTLGIDSDFIATLSVAFGSTIAAISAVAIFPLGTISIEQGYVVLINALAVSIVGGLGSTGGLIIAAFIIGYLQTFTSAYIDTQWVMFVPPLIILAVLALKPSGLFGKQKELEERV